MGGRRRRCLAELAASYLVFAVPAAASAAPSDSAPRRTSEAGAAAVENDEAPPPPRPDQAHGLRTRAPTNARTAAYWAPRAVLFVPRYAIELALQPLRLGAIAYDRYAVRARAEAVFFNEDRSFGVYPLAFIETGFGLNVGARVLHRNLFGHGEGLHARASFGGLYRQRYEIDLSSGRLLGDRLELGVGVGFRIVRRARFFGIGNADEHPFDPEAPPLDAWSQGAVDARYARDEVLAAISAKIALRDPFRLRLTTQLAWRRFSDPHGDTLAVGRAFDLRTVTGFASGQQRAYTEAELVIDTTRYAGSHLPRATPSRGWLVHTWAGLGIGFGGDRSRYVRAGTDVQRFIDLRHGNRVLRLRGWVDVLNAPRSRVAFIDLPTLGGPTMLRGYVRERFRGRMAALGSAEYSWPIDRTITAFLFTDIGRVWSTWPLEMKRPRVGFGGGLLLATRRRFFARIQIAGSIDGEVFFNLRFEPAWRIDD